MTERMPSQVQASKMKFFEASKELHCLTRFIALRFENLLTSSRCFSELKDLSLDGLTYVSGMPQERPPNKLYLPKQVGEDQLDEPELDGPITLMI